MKLAFDALAFGSLFGANTRLVVIAAATVVVLAIVVVFIMVLRSDSGDSKTARGLAYDADEGPAGQPQGGRERASARGANADDWGSRLPAPRGGFGGEAHRPGDFGGTVGSAGGYKGTSSRPQSQPAPSGWGRGAAGWGEDQPAANGAAGWAMPADPAPAWNDQQDRGWNMPPAAQRPASQRWHKIPPVVGPCPAQTQDPATANPASSKGGPCLTSRPGTISNLVGELLPDRHRPAPGGAGWNAPSAPAQQGWAMPNEAAAPPQQGWAMPDEAGAAQQGWAMPNEAPAARQRAPEAPAQQGWAMPNEAPAAPQQGLGHARCGWRSATARVGHA